MDVSQGCPCHPPVGDMKSLPCPFTTPSGKPAGHVWGLCPQGSWLLGPCPHKEAMVSGGSDGLQARVVLAPEARRVPAPEHGDPHCLLGASPRGSAAMERPPPGVQSMVPPAGWLLGSAHRLRGRLPLL